MRGGR